MTTHFREICEHGFLVRQCRCPNPAKTRTIVPCPWPDDHAHLPAIERGER